MKINDVEFSIEGIDSCGYHYIGLTNKSYMMIHYFNGTDILIPVSNYEEYHKWSIKIYEVIKENEK